MAAEVKATGDHTVLNNKLFTSFGENFYCNSFDILVTDSDIHRGIKYTITIFVKLTFYYKKSHYWYLAITYRR